MKLEKIEIKNPIQNKNTYVSDIKYENNDLIIDIKRCLIHYTYIYIDEILEKNKLHSIFEKIVQIMFENQEKWFGKNNLSYDACFDVLEMFSEKSTKDVIILDVLKDNKIIYNSKVNISLRIKNIIFYKSKGMITIDINSIQPLVTKCNIDKIDQSKNEYLIKTNAEPSFDIKEELQTDINRIELSVQNFQNKSDKYLEKYLREKLKEESAQIMLSSLTEHN